MPITARAGRSSSREYAVAGATLAEIDRAIERAGPRDPNDGQRYSGACICTLRVAIGRGDIAFATGSGGQITATFGGGTVFADCATELPRLRSPRGLSPAALREWERFADSVRRHESGHADAYLDTARDLAIELNALSATGTGSPPRAAQAEAARALVDRASRLIGGTVLRDRANASARAYDGRNGHGRSQGAVLNTGIA